MTEKVQINLRAGADQKARWEAYVEESGRFATLSELIRASVEAEISQSDTDTQSPTPALSGDIQQLREELSTVRKNVAWLREHFQEDVDISELAQTVFDALKPLPDIEGTTSGRHELCTTPWRSISRSPRARTRQRVRSSSTAAA